MLYPTPHHSFLFPFPHSSLSPPSTASFSLSSFSSPPPLQEMERVNGALKSSFMPETPLKPTTHQACMEEFWAVNDAQGCVVPGDEFSIDDLLDFSNGFSETEEQYQADEEDGPEEKPAKENSPVSSVQATNAEAFCKEYDFGSLSCDEIGVSGEELESLEWLSHFVEDSDYSLTEKLPPKPTENWSEPRIPAKTAACFTTPVQTKARTKRARTGVRVWPLASPSLTESSTSSSSSSASSTTSFPPRLVPVQTHTAESLLGMPPAKKQKKKPTTAEGGTCGTQQPRRCSHCGVTKTPQWRAGPLGSKTLCNACGVRFKSGRLLPEYRPACSPTFCSELHSNNHRKVLEMRRQKESESAGLPPPVQSF